MQGFRSKKERKKKYDEKERKRKKKEKLVSDSICYDWEWKDGKMLEVQQTEFLREGEACNPSIDILHPDLTETSVSERKSAERSVSFNRDVHVKRIALGINYWSYWFVRHWEKMLYLTKHEKHTEHIKNDIKDLKLEILIWKTTTVQVHRKSSMRRWAKRIARWKSDPEKN